MGSNIDGRMFDDQELELRVVDEGDGGLGSARDFVVAALEIDDAVVVDAALLAQGKVEVEQGGGGFGARVPSGGSRQRARGWWRRRVTRRGCHKALSLTKEKVPKRRLILPHSISLRACICLRGGCDELGDAEPAQGAPEFAPRVAAVAAGAWDKEVERIGGDCSSPDAADRGGAGPSETKFPLSHLAPLLMAGDLR